MVGFKTIHSYKRTVSNRTTSSECTDGPYDIRGQESIRPYIRQGLTSLFLLLGECVREEGQGRGDG